MKLFDAWASLNKPERTLNVGCRILGLDIDIACYGFLNDWAVPFMFIPSLRGIFCQIVCVAVFLGHLKDQPKVEPEISIIGIGD